MEKKCMCKTNIGLNKMCINKKEIRKDTEKPCD